MTSRLPTNLVGVSRCLVSLHLLVELLLFPCELCLVNSCRRAADLSHVVEDLIGIVMYVSLILSPSPIYKAGERAIRREESRSKAAVSTTLKGKSTAATLHYHFAVKAIYLLSCFIPCIVTQYMKSV